MKFNVFCHILYLMLQGKLIKYRQQYCHKFLLTVIAFEQQKFQLSELRGL